MAGVFSQVGIGWTVGVPSGWGTYGANLAVELMRQGIEPALFLLHQQAKLPREQAELLRPALFKRREWHARSARGGLKLDFPMLLSLGDKLDFYDVLNGTRGRPTVGIPFFESATIPAANIETARQFDLIVAGSSWNAEVMAGHGLANVRTCLQGVDLDIFKPGRKSERFAGRFVVFSGGKLEYRKGQDLVVAAFKRFHANHPDALLLTVWHNPWPQLAANVAMSTHVDGAPSLGADGALDIAGWLRANGLPEGSFFEAGAYANTAMPALLHEADLAVFPSRCEGGTNLVAMEAMACGVPTALSRNTGHLDLIRPDNCYSLDLQLPMGAVTKRADLEGWGETVVEELVSKMEQAYTDRADAAARGAAGAAFMRDWGWSAQIGRLLEALREFS